MKKTPPKTSGNTKGVIKLLIKIRDFAFSDLFQNHPFWTQSLLWGSPDDSQEGVQIECFHRKNESFVSQKEVIFMKNEKKPLKRRSKKKSIGKINVFFTSGA